eukprot:NODE_7800_length_384_cov_124.253731_g6100_i0.p2 GENE.NODE_7800_length_384_cov_124.253731_g6100_i0~~NODE_7800_length_384_cov_124.253731_g6100_i0.p2  ORF type:complete len:111 (+),score=33.86 NODE_7800_length_384_cov_124.253731_g6100_i0:33-335(+)
MGGAPAQVQAQLFHRNSLLQAASARNSLASNATFLESPPTLGVDRIVSDISGPVCLWPGPVRLERTDRSRRLSEVAVGSIEMEAVTIRRPASHPADFGCI